jgi:hypothetical protein
LISITLLLAYIALGHFVIRAGFESEIPIFQRIFSGKSVTSLQQYFAAFDRSALIISLYFLISVSALALLINPLGLLLSGISLWLVSVVLFVTLDRFPELVQPLHFDVIPYFNYRLTYIPDPMLGFRERPYHKAQITNFRGFGFSPLYGIDVKPQTLRWHTDGEGFRNPPETSSADIAMIGSSFLKYGTDLEDIYSVRLAKKLDGEKVVNLGKAGYGPIEYMKVIEKYALKKKPRYVVFALAPSADIDGHLGDWVKGERDSSLAKRSIAFGGFLPRYRIAIQQAWQILSISCWTGLQLGFQNLVGTKFVHPDVAILRLPNNVTQKIVFLDLHSEKPTDELLHSAEWRAFEDVLRKFKRLSEEHEFVPIIVFIPLATEIYAKYSTLESGENWLRVRNSQIASTGNNERAARTLADEFAIPLIDLTPAFEEAARQGVLLYYPMDSHWNEKGRELAAEITARALKAILPSREGVDKIQNESQNKLERVSE